MGSVITLIGCVFYAIAWQGNFELWVANPGITPMAHAVRDPHFGATAAAAFSASIVSTTGVYKWYYTIGLRSIGKCFQAASFFVVLSALFLAAGIIHVASAGSFQQGQARILGADDSSINHHLGGFLGTASLAWAGHLVHVAIPRSRGISASWSNLLTQVAHHHLALGIVAGIFHLTCRPSYALYTVLRIGNLETVLASSLAVVAWAAIVASGTMWYRSASNPIECFGPTRYMCDLGLYLQAVETIVQRS